VETYKDHFEEVGVYRKILKWILNKMMRLRELGSSGSEARGGFTRNKVFVFDFYKMQDNCCLAEKFLAAQEVCSTELIF
jgi:hypothetical protein